MERMFDKMMERVSTNGVSENKVSVDGGTSSKKEKEKSAVANLEKPLAPNLIHPAALRVLSDTIGYPRSLVGSQGATAKQAAQLLAPHAGVSKLRAAMVARSLACNGWSNLVRRSCWMLLPA